MSTSPTCGSHHGDARDGLLGAVYGSDRSGVHRSARPGLQPQRAVGLERRRCRPGLVFDRRDRLVVGQRPGSLQQLDHVRVQVAAPSGGGGGGGGSGGGGASVAASGVKVSPAHPKAGATVTASIGVTRGGSPVRVGHVTCAATAGSAKVPGRGQHGLGSASCAFKTSAAEKGRVLRGSVSVSAGGKSLRRSFSARLR